MRGRRPGLATRLFLVQVLVVVAGGVTTGMVATLAGPAIFHDHLRRAGTLPPEAEVHVEQAYASASVISLVVALVAALGTAIVVSAYVARRVADPIGALARAAADVADGHYGVRASAPSLSPEFDTLVAAFNRLAASLQAVEATRGRMLADLAHEMRTPLATIEAYLEAAEDGVAVPDEDNLRVLRSQTGRLRRLSEDVAAVSRAEEDQLDLHPRPVGPAEIVDSAVAAARPHYADRGVRLVTEVQAGLPPLVADPDRIGQALTNVLDNALRHTPEGGQVTVTARAGRLGVDFVVADTGAGIAPQHLPHVFERFYRADPARDRARGGSGIGLAIVRAVVTAHGGRVSAASPGPGRGATFVIALPAGASTPARASTPAGAAAAEPDPPPGPGGGRP
jgi:two-component system sensor histidine kinase BaeS